MPYCVERFAEVECDHSDVVICVQQLLTLIGRKVQNVLFLCKFQFGDGGHLGFSTFCTILHFWHMESYMDIYKTPYAKSGNDRTNGSKVTNMSVFHRKCIEFESAQFWDFRGETEIFIFLNPKRHLPPCAKHAL